MALAANTIGGANGGGGVGVPPDELEELDELELLELLLVAPPLELDELLEACGGTGFGKFAWVFADGIPLLFNTNSTPAKPSTTKPNAASPPNIISFIPEVIPLPGVTGAGVVAGVVGAAVSVAIDLRD